MFLPLFVYAFFFIKKHNAILFFKVSIASCIAVVLVPFIQDFLPAPNFDYTSFFKILFRTFLFDGLIEEGIKMISFTLLFLLVEKKQPEKDNHIAILFGVSFATIESFFYFFLNANSLFIRIPTALLLHTGIARFYPRLFNASISKKIRLVCTVFTLHTIYNVALFYAGGALFFSALAVLLCWLL